MMLPAVGRIGRAGPLIGMGGVSLAALIAALFANGEQGGFYDAASMDGQFVDSLGTTPVTAAGDQVGLKMDKRLWGGKTLAQVKAARPIELSDDFTTDTSATYADVGTPTKSVSGGELHVVNNGATASQARKGFTASITGYAFVEVTQRRVVGTAVSRVRTAGGTNLGEVTTTSATNVVQSFCVPVTAGSSYNFDFGNGGSTSGNEAALDSFQIVIIPGNHRIQATSASRTILAREPVGGRRNIRVQTETFSDSSYVKTRSTITDNAIVAPNGALTADKFVEDFPASLVILWQQEPTLYRCTPRRENERTSLSVWLKTLRRPQGRIASTSI